MVALPGVAVGLPLLVATAPIWMVGALVVDLASGLRTLPSLRLGAFAVAYLAHEWIGVVGYTVLRIRFGLPRRLRRSGGDDRRAELLAHRRIQAWWADSLLRWADRLLGLRIDLPPTVELPPGGLILLSRHASMVDAILPAALVASRADRFIHYVMKDELQWIPTVELFSRSLGNHFVARGDLGEAAGVARFARAALDESVLTIFPEGTFATPESRRRVRERLTRRRSGRLGGLGELALSLRHLLPPRPAGTLALLTAQPDRDVVVLGHVGLEHVGRLGDLRRHLPLPHPVVVEWWHHPRHELPADRADLIDWLNDRWRRLDAWVDEVTSSRHDQGGLP